MSLRSGCRCGPAASNQTSRRRRAARRSSGAQELPHGQPARLHAHHRRLTDHHAGPIARGDQATRVGAGGGDGLFAQHMLPGVGGALGPGDVQVVRQRIVDRVNLGIGQQRLVGGVRSGDAVRASGLRGFGAVA